MRNKKKKLILFLASLALTAAVVNASTDKKITGKKMDAVKNEEVATLAGGCFWCLESDLEKVPGVIKVVSGFSGGNVVNPSYEDVSKGTTGHREAVQVYFDPSRISYAELLDYYWKIFDPTDAEGSFNDRGVQYTSAIFYHNAEQKSIAEKSKDQLESLNKFSNPVVTPIIKFENFWTAEEYHQDYYHKNPTRYWFYRSLSGRNDFIEKNWGDIHTESLKDASAKGQKLSNAEHNIPSDKELKNKLTELQYSVIRENGTEPPFKNEYWNEKRDGIYVDRVSGEVLFSSKEKFDSGTGWPSFYKPLEPGNIIEESDNTFFMTRTEVHSKNADSHLGHVFKDGPQPTGLRYCLNSASLRFIPVSELKEQGYEKYLDYFD